MLLASVLLYIVNDAFYSKPNGVKQGGRQAATKNRASDAPSVAALSN